MTGVAVALVLIVAAVAAVPLIYAREAERTGELRFHVRGVFGEQVVRRAEDPERFALEVKLLRAVPWFGAALLAITVLLFGLTW